MLNNLSIGAKTKTSSTSLSLAGIFAVIMGIYGVISLVDSTNSIKNIDEKLIHTHKIIAGHEKFMDDMLHQNCVSLAVDKDRLRGEDALKEAKEKGIYNNLIKQCDNTHGRKLIIDMNIIKI